MSDRIQEIRDSAKVIERNTGGFFSTDTKEYVVLLNSTEADPTITPSIPYKFLDVENLSDTYHLILSITFTNGSTEYVSVSPDSGYKQVFPKALIESVKVECTPVANFLATNGDTLVTAAFPTRYTTGTIGGVTVNAIVRFINT